MGAFPNTRSEIIQNLYLLVPGQPPIGAVKLTGDSMQYDPRLYLLQAGAHQINQDLSPRNSLITASSVIDKGVFFGEPSADLNNDWYGGGVSDYQETTAQNSTGSFTLISKCRIKTTGKISFFGHRVTNGGATLGFENSDMFLTKQGVAGTWATTSDWVPLNTWMVVGVVHDPSNDRYECWLNGQLEDSGNSTEASFGAHDLHCFTEANRNEFYGQIQTMQYFGLPMPQAMMARLTADPYYDLTPA